jgi:hypothetical protein
VPVWLDALALASDQAFVEASADYTRLPYTDGRRDFNPDVANLSEEIGARPFQNQNLYLKRGIHLHWAMPDTLARGRQPASDKPLTPAESLSRDVTAAALVFPPLPNRWLIVRSGDPARPPRAWVIESDYLHPEGLSPRPNAVSIPFAPNPDAGAFQPFRFLGRSVSLALWQGESAPAERVGQLTVVGYEHTAEGGHGDPTFAAFYPNCHSVFGFYDSDYDASSFPDGLQYDLLGWYTRPEQDYLAAFARDQRGQTQLGSAATTKALREALMAAASWQANVADAQPFPEGMTCYARLTMRRQPEAGHGQPMQVAVGNTGVEALSALLAHQLEADRAPAPDAQRRAIIEDQLEALHLAARLERHTLDVGAKFREARHERQFAALAAGTQWTVRLAPLPTESGVEPQADADVAKLREQVALLDNDWALLRRLNQLQQLYDQSADEVEALRQQLFADWYKYMLCAYPPEDSRELYPGIDEVRHFLRAKGIAPIQRKIDATFDASQDTLEAHRNGALEQLYLRLQQRNREEPAPPSARTPQAKRRITPREARARWEIQRSLAPRYWQPSDPVVLLAGPDARPTRRHGQDGVLRCPLAPFNSIAELLTKPAEEIARVLGAIVPLAEGDVGFVTSNGKPWNPIVLDWELALFPMRSHGNVYPETLRYATDFVGHNYALPPNEPDFRPPGNAGLLAQVASVYRGSSILSAHADELLALRLDLYLRQEIGAEFNAQAGTPLPTDGTLVPRLSEIETWYLRQNLPNLATAEQQAADPVYNAIKAYRRLQRFDSLSQTLGGFNEALLMRRQVRQLAIDEPLGFPDARALTAEVRGIVQSFSRSAPEPQSDFTPIRSGALKLLRLHLIDTFGQVRRVSVDTVIAANSLSFGAGQNLVGLPPRLVQPARLNVRWLSAAGDQETSDAPETSPICGWVLPNYLDTSLLIYDADGVALGTIGENSAWEAAPGADKQEASLIDNQYLRRLVAHLLAQGEGFIGPLLTAFDATLQQIDPASAAQHPDLALLMGRPLALVRATVDLQLRGRPAVHQGWNNFRQDLRRNTRDHDNFTRVRFPIRLGEYGQLNDGLVGYWLEEEGGALGATFYAPQIDGSDNPRIRSGADELPISRSVDDLPLAVSMLLDPRGVVHITSGIQPVKSISIPPADYIAALRAIAVTFKTAPLLTGAAIELPLPAEPGYTWSWIEHAPEGWAETDLEPSAAITEARFAGPAELRDGWLKLRPVPGNENQPQG